jgi:hypothetical protein
VNHPTEQRCETCLYWQWIGPPTDGEQQDGECRRNAPVGYLEHHDTDHYRVAWWPLTLAGEWCGEWAPAALRQGKVEG